MANEKAVFKWMADTTAVDDALDKTRAKGEAIGPAVQSIIGKVDKLRERQLALADSLSKADTALSGDKVKIAAVRAELEKTTAALNQFGGAIQHSVTKSSKQIKGLELAARSTATSMEQLTKGKMRLRESMGGAATATSGLSSALSGASGKANDVLGAADNLAMAFAVGGPLAIGITAAATGVGYLVSNYFEAEKAAKAVKEGNEQFARSMQQDIVDEVDAAISRIASLQDELTGLGKTGPQIRLITATEGQAAAQRTLNDLMQDEVRLAAAIAKQQEQISEYGHSARLNARNFVNEAERAKAVLSEQLDRVQKQREESERLVNTTGLEVGEATTLLLKYEEIEKTRERDKANRKDINASLKAETALAAQLSQLDDEYMAARGRRITYLEKLREEAIAFGLKKDVAAEKKRREEMETTFDLMRKTNAEVDKLRDERKRAETAYYDGITNQALQFGSTVAGVGIGAVNGLTQAVIEGRGHQKEAWQAIGAQALSEVGGILVGQGTAWGFEGAALAIKSGGTNPQGWALMGLGAGAVSAGLGMGAGGMALAHTSAGGQIGQPLPSSSDPSSRSAASSPGLGPIGSSEGGGQQASHYHFHAPVFGDHNRSARHVESLYHRSQRDLLGGRTRR